MAPSRRSSWSHRATAWLPDQLEVLHRAKPIGKCNSTPGLSSYSGMRRCHFAKGHPELAARQVGPEAAVHAAAKGDVTVDLAIEVDDERVLELGRIHVGGAEAHRQHVAGLDRAPPTLASVVALPGGAGHRRLPPEQLLDGLGYDGRILGDWCRYSGLRLKNA